MTRIVLASASSGRFAVLRSAGIEPLVIVSGVDEDAVVAQLPAGSGPGDTTGALARAKARAVVPGLDAGLRADCVVLGCDSMLYRGGTLWGKPPSEQAAIDGWREMSGTSGELFSGHCAIVLRDGAVVEEFVEHAATTVHFGSPSEADLAAYARSGEPTAVAGGFTLDGLGGWFVDRIEGDASNVIGISLPLTRRMLERAGFSISSLWQANPLTP